jgi:GTP-binding protein
MSRLSSAAATHRTFATKRAPATAATAAATARAAAIPSSTIGHGIPSLPPFDASSAPRRRPRLDRVAARTEALCRALAVEPVLGASLEGRGLRSAGRTDSTIVVASASSSSTSSSSNSSSSNSLELPTPKEIRVKTAEYVGSSVTPAGCPAIPPSGPYRPEFAFLGRSNVGKSSLVNCLAGRSKGGGGGGSAGSLAMVSSTPGKTATINHYLINNAWYMVDLPGYGYARRAQSTRVDWAEFTQAYLLERPTLASAFLLADVSVPPQDADVEAAVWMAERNVPFSVVLTKADKRKKAAKAPPPEANAAELKRLLSANLPNGELPPIWATSSATGAGRKELLAYMSQLRQLCADRWGKGGLEGGVEVVSGAAASASVVANANAASAASKRGKDGGAPDDVEDEEWW